MNTDNVMGSKEVRDVKIAQWEGFRRLAAKLPNHHVLAVELVRTFDDETAAVFTVVQNREPVRYVVFGDAQGRVKPQHECGPRIQAMAFAAAGDPPPPPSGDGGGDQSPDFSLGHPPVQQEPTPGIVALAAALLPLPFNVADHVDTSK